MPKIESMIKSEIVRLAKGEVRRIAVPLAKDVRLLKSTVSRIRKTVLVVERFVAAQKKELAKQELQLEVSPEELKKSRLSPRLIRSLRRHLGITQKELASLAGVTMGAVQSWESGKFRPKDGKRKALVALRKLRRNEVRKLLKERAGK